MDWIWAIGMVGLVYALHAWISKNKNKLMIKNLPPGPKGYPIIGNILMLGDFPHVDLHRLAQKHGDIMYLQLGTVPTVVASSPQAAELFLKTHDLGFATRPQHESAKYMSYGQRNLGFAEYGPYWRNIRKMCTLALLSSHKISSFKPMRKEEVDLFVDFIRKASLDRLVVDLSAKINSLSENMTCRLVFGKKYVDKEFEEKGFHGWIQTYTKQTGAPNFGDYLPFLAPFDLQGLTKRMKVVSKVLDEFFEKVIDEHIKSKQDGQERTKDFVDVMLGFIGSDECEYKIEGTDIKAIILDMVAGSMDTSATAVEWTLSELMRQPRVMKKLQKELENAVGMERMVDESDLEKLHYLNMVVKESFRLHPVVPLLIPHAAIEDSTVKGFHIPKKANVIVNVWAIGRDPSVWSEPEKFVPERFVGSNVDVYGRDFQLLPFGSGRRGCPGMQLGLTVVLLVVAQLVHCFDWELPDNMLPSELDMSEEFGLTVPRAKHLLAIPTYRLHQ